MQAFWVVRLPGCGRNLVDDVEQLTCCLLCKALHESQEATFESATESSKKESLVVLVLTFFFRADDLTFEFLGPVMPCTCK